MNRIIAFCIVIFAISIFFASCSMECAHDYDNAADAVCNLCSESRDVSVD